MAPNKSLPAVHYCKSDNCPLPDLLLTKSDSSPCKSKAAAIMNNFSRIYSNVGIKTRNIPLFSRSHQSFPLFKYTKLQDENEDFARICQICNGNVSKEEFAYPCNCRGIFGTVHKSCMESYVNGRNDIGCNACDNGKANIPTERIGKYSFKQYISDRLNCLQAIGVLVAFSTAFILFLFTAKAMTVALNNNASKYENIYCKTNGLLTPQNFTNSTTLEQTVDTDVSVNKTQRAELACSKFKRYPNIYLFFFVYLPLALTFIFVFATLYYLLIHDDKTTFKVKSKK